MKSKSEKGIVRAGGREREEESKGGRERREQQRKWRNMEHIRMQKTTIRGSGRWETIWDYFHLRGGWPGLGSGRGGRAGGGGPGEATEWWEGFKYARISDMVPTSSANEGRSSALRRERGKEGMVWQKQIPITDSHRATELKRGWALKPNSSRMYKPNNECEGTHSLPWPAAHHDVVDRRGTPVWFLQPLVTLKHVHNLLASHTLCSQGRKRGRVWRWKEGENKECQARL